MHCGMPKINYGSSSWVPLTELAVAILESGVKYIHWTTPSTEMLDPYIILNARKFLKRDFSICIKLKYIVAFCNSQQGKGL